VNKEKLLTPAKRRRLRAVSGVAGCWGRGVDAEAEADKDVAAAPKEFP